uniref:Uncharacterized protein n=1 Tax=Ciona intestinalis TaxID=7719 RepID=H2XTE4_CIOIN
EEHCKYDEERSVNTHCHCDKYLIRSSTSCSTTSPVPPTTDGSNESKSDDLNDHL